MKNLAKLLSVFAATVVALVSHAQVTTQSTTASFNNSTSSIGGNATVGQTFTNIEAISSFTYNFFSAGSSPASFSAQWAVYNGSGSVDSLANWTTVLSFPQVNIPGFVSANANGWTELTNGNGTYNTFTYTFNFGGFELTNPALTYSLLLTNLSGSAAGVSLGFSGDAFAYGNASVGFTLGPGAGAFADYTFSNIVYVQGGDEVPAPTPEASTMAALAAAALVAGLVIKRRRQRNQASLASLVPAV